MGYPWTGLPFRLIDISFISSFLKFVDVYNVLPIIAGVLTKATNMYSGVFPPIKFSSLIDCSSTGSDFMSTEQSSYTYEMGDALILSKYDLRNGDEIYST